MLLENAESALFFFFFNKHLIYKLHLIIARVHVNICSSMTFTELVVSSPDLNCLKISFSCVQYIFFWVILKIGQNHKARDFSKV